MRHGELRQRVLDYLAEHSEGSSIGVAEALGGNRSTVLTHLRRLNKLGLIHVARWERTGQRPSFMIYKHGPGEDAPRPTSYSNPDDVARDEFTRRVRFLTKRNKQLMLEVE